MRYASLATAAALLFSAGVAMAGTKVQGNLVDVDVVPGLCPVRSRGLGQEQVPAEG